MKNNWIDQKCWDAAGRGAVLNRWSWDRPHWEGDIWRRGGKYVCKLPCDSSGRASLAEGAPGKGSQVGCLAGWESAGRAVWLGQSEWGREQKKMRSGRWGVRASRALEAEVDTLGFSLTMMGTTGEISQQRSGSDIVYRSHFSLSWEG